jgi:tetratricopeptide (TPR) repeat protein
MNMKRQASLSAGAILLATIAAPLCLAAGADDRPKAISLTARDPNGMTITVPRTDRPTVLLFVRAGQEQSQQAVEELKKSLAGLLPVQVLVVLSGEDAAAPGAKKLRSTIPWTVLMDAEYAVVGRLSVRVWPTALLISSDGQELTRLTGLPQSYGRDLAAYLAFATGRISRQALEDKLHTSGVVSDSAQQMALRHLAIAQSLLEKGMVDPAWQEIERGLKLQPEDPRLLLIKARTLLLMHEPRQATKVLDRMDGKSPLGGRVQALRGEALVAMEEWDKAIAVLQQALKLNPEPSEAYYFLGLAYERKGQLGQAAQAFRAAYEATPGGRLIGVAHEHPATAPATQIGK